MARCHSVREVHSPVARSFQEFLVASEKAVKFVLFLVVRVSASPPRNRVKVTLLRYIWFLLLPAVPGRGTQKASDEAPKRVEVHRWGNWTGFRRALRANSKSGTLAGGADKAE